jgi:hypothetical protein
MDSFRRLYSRISDIFNSVATICLQLMISSLEIFGSSSWLARWGSWVTGASGENLRCKLLNWGRGSCKPYLFHLVSNARLIWGSIQSFVWLCWLSATSFGRQTDDVTAIIDREVLLNYRYQRVIGWMFSVFFWNIEIHWFDKLSAIQRAYWVESPIFFSVNSGEHCCEICSLPMLQFNILNGSVKYDIGFVAICIDWDFRLGWFPCWCSQWSISFKLIMTMTFHF